jgi:hypothetical protein
MLDEFEYDSSAEFEGPESKQKISRSPCPAMPQPPRSQMAPEFWPCRAVGEVCKAACKMLKRRKNYRSSEFVERCIDALIMTLGCQRRNSVDSKSSCSHAQ